MSIMTASIGTAGSAGPHHIATPSGRKTVPRIQPGLPLPPRKPSSRATSPGPGAALGAVARVLSSRSQLPPLPLPLQMTSGVSSAPVPLGPPSSMPPSTTSPPVMAVPPSPVHSQRTAGSGSTSVPFLGSAAPPQTSQQPLRQLVQGAVRSISPPPVHRGSAPSQWPPKTQTQTRLPPQTQPQAHAVTPPPTQPRQQTPPKRPSSNINQPPPLMASLPLSAAIAPTARSSTATNPAIDVPATLYKGSPLPVPPGKTPPMIPPPTIQCGQKPPLPNVPQTAVPTMPIGSSANQEGIQVVKSSDMPPADDGLFMDLQFPPVNESLKNPNATARVENLRNLVDYNSIVWVRGSKIATKLFNNLHPQDLTHELIGDNWFLAAVAALAEFPERIRSLFAESDINPKGKYSIRIFDPTLCCWNWVEIDDYLPHTLKQGQLKPAFARPKHSELWVLLLEKACAKWFGSYTKMHGKNHLVTLMILCELKVLKTFTQMPSPTLLNSDWNALDWEFKQGVLPDAKDRTSYHEIPVQRINSDQLFAELASGDHANSIMLAWSMKDLPSDHMKGYGPGGEAISMNGILKGAAYAIVGVQTHVADGYTWRIAHMRNLWGQFELTQWTGALSEHWIGWSHCPQLMKQLALKDRTWLEEQLFFMPWKDFVRTFSHVGIAYVGCTKGMEKHAKRSMRRAQNVAHTVDNAPAEKYIPISPGIFTEQGDSLPPPDGKFVDREFPPVASTILRNETCNDQTKELREAVQDGVVWKRGSTQATMLFNNVHPNDIVMGMIGNCWAMAGIAAIAEFPDRIRSLFAEKELSRDGKYNIRLFDPNARQWTWVTIDDYIPFVHRDGELKPLGAQPKDNELWVLLLEKACAKWFGGYAKMNGGVALVIPMVLCELQLCRAFSQESGWSYHGANYNVLGWNSTRAYLKDARDRLSYEEVPQGHVTSDELFAELVAADEANGIMVAWSAKTPPADGVRGHGPSGEPIAKDGIVKGHAYSLIGVHTHVADGYTWRVAQVRNPWGANPLAEWTGPLSKHWIGWPQCPELQKILAVHDEDQLGGMFFMPWKDFLKRFSHVGIAYVGCTEGMEKYGKQEMRRAQGLPPGTKGLGDLPPDPDGLFVDPEFPPVNASILKGATSHDVLQDIRHQLAGGVVWIRGSTFAGSLFNRVHPHELTQGLVGDCWALAAIVAVAEFPELVHNLFKEQQLNEEGQYHVRIFDPSKVRWQWITIDDYIPHTFRDGQLKPFGAQPKHAELWVLLLEKACAKWFGGYSKMSGGIALSILMVLCEHNVCRTFSQESMSSPTTSFSALDWHAKQAYLRDGKDRLSYQEIPIGQMSSDDLFAELVAADTANSIMMAWSTKDPPLDSVRGYGPNGEPISKDGIVKGHPYIVLGVHTYLADGYTWRIVHLRNPWAANKLAEWTGALSDTWVGWQQCPEMQSLLIPEGTEALEGIFFMPWKDFLKRFSHASITYVGQIADGKEKFGKQELRKGHSAMHVAPSTLSSSQVPTTRAGPSSLSQAASKRQPQPSPLVCYARPPSVTASNTAVKEASEKDVLQSPSDITISESKYGSTPTATPRHSCFEVSKIDPPEQLSFAVEELSFDSQRVGTPQRQTPNARAIASSSTAVRPPSPATSVKASADVQQVSPVTGLQKLSIPREDPSQQRRHDRHVQVLADALRARCGRRPSLLRELGQELIETMESQQQQDDPPMARTPTWGGPSPERTRGD